MRLTSSARVSYTVGLVVLLVAASAIGPLAWGQLHDAFAEGVGAAKPVVVPITPFRLVDTRPASEDPVLGGPHEPFGQGETRTYQVAGVGGVPVTAVGVALNVTALGASTDSFLTLFPAGSGLPSTSTLNPAPGATVFNSATVLLGAGKFSVFHNAGSVHVIVDVVGYLVDHDHDDRYLEQNQPIVMTESAGSWRALSNAQPAVFEVVGHALLASGTTATPERVVAYSLPLSGPASVGGTQYRLTSIEYCVRTITAGAIKVDIAGVFSDRPSTGAATLEVFDQTDRTATGCYTVSLPSVTARSYGLILSVGLTGPSVGSLSITGVRSTWVPTTGAAAVIEEPAPAVDPSASFPPEVVAQLVA